MSVDRHAWKPDPISAGFRRGKLVHHHHHHILTSMSSLSTTWQSIFSDTHACTPISEFPVVTGISHSDAYNFEKIPFSHHQACYVSKGMLEQNSGDRMFFLASSRSDKGRDAGIWQPLQRQLKSASVPYIIISCRQNVTRLSTECHVTRLLTVS